MQTSRLAKIILPLFFILFSTSIHSQELDVYNMIGLKLNSVIKKYGKPIHQDRSNPEMECIFYKTKISQKIFVSNREGIFQAEGTHCYNNRAKAMNAIKTIIRGNLKKGNTVDTLNAIKFEFITDKTKVTLSLFENSNSKEYEVRMKARRAESLK